jgi:YD repeat-containing protein
MMKRKKKNVFIALAIVSLLFVGSAHAISKVPAVRHSVKSLDLSKPPTTEEIMAAGQLGGQLYPTHEITDKEKEKRISLSFGKAIQEWNKHNYKEAVRMFKKYVEEYPDSPWASEAVLHEGCDATYNGRYAEAEKSFNWILDKNKDAQHDGSKKLVNKTRLRLGVLKFYQNNLKEAGKYFAELLQSSDNWRERTYASHWIQRLARLSSNKLAMFNCGTLALARVLERDGREKEARAAREIPAFSESGDSMKDLRDAAAVYGYDFVGLRISPGEIAKMPLPAIVQLGGRSNGDGGHYWVVESVNDGNLELFDPQAHRRFYQSTDEFRHEWKGNVLVLKKEGAVPGPGTKLADSEMQESYGGCCGAPPPPSNLGDPGENGRGQGNGGCGAPVWSVNMISLNLFMTDTPMWYRSPIGPSVEITLSYNSQSSITYHQPFGNKWQFNYASYLIVDTGGQVTVYMPDGRQDVFSPLPLCEGDVCRMTYNSSTGDFNTLIRIEENHFKLRFPDDSIYEYNIPSGTNSLQPFLTKITDQHGQSLTFGYDSNVNLTTITDALGRITTLTYDIKGRVTTAADPFGRTATFDYDENDNLVKMTDMGGYWTSFTYDNNVYLASLTNPRGTWGFYIEPADGVPLNGDNYPPPGDPMFANYRITVTNPEGKKEEYFIYAGCDSDIAGCFARSWYVSPKYYAEWESQSVNNWRLDVPKTKYFFTTVNGEGRISSVLYPDGGQVSYSYDPATGRRASIQDQHGHTTSFTYNNAGFITSVTDAKQKTTTMTYNNRNLTGIEDGLGTVTMVYDNFHDVTSVTDRMGKTTGFTYNQYGQITSFTDALGGVTNYGYYDAASDKRFKLKEMTRDNKTIESFDYDAAGRVRSHTDSTGLTLTYNYDSLDRITSITYPDGRQTTYAYSGCCPWLIDSYTDVVCL